MSIPNFLDYPFEIRPLTEEEGGGFLITFPDLPEYVGWRSLRLEESSL